MDTELRQANLRSAVPRAHSTTGRASPRSSSWLGHSVSPGIITLNPLCSQAASRATLGASPSLSRQRSTARASGASQASPVSTSSPFSSAPVTAPSRSSAAIVRSAAPSMTSPGCARKLEEAAARLGLAPRTDAA